MAVISKTRHNALKRGLLLRHCSLTHMPEQEPQPAVELLDCGVCTSPIRKTMHRASLSKQLCCCAYEQCPEAAGVHAPQA